MLSNIRSGWTELADTLGQTGIDILAGAPVTVTDKRCADPKVMAIMLMSRTLSNFRGVFLLLESGLLVEARVLVRCCFENAFWIAGLFAEGDRFVRKMLQDEMRSRHVRGELALSDKSQLPEEVENRVRKQMQAINKKWRGSKSLNTKEVALSGLLRHGYLIYSQLSADAVHPTVTSLNRHAGRCDMDGEALIDVVPTLKEEEVAITCDWACNAMLGACVAVNEILGGTLAGQRLEQIADRYKALMTQPKAAGAGGE